MKRPIPLKLLLLVAAVALLLLSVRLLPMRAWLEGFVAWVSGTGIAGVAVFAAVYVVAAVLFLP